MNSFLEIGANIEGLIRWEIVGRMGVDVISIIRTFERKDGVGVFFLFGN